MAKKKYFKAKCAICDKFIALLPNDYKKTDITILCIPCGEKNGKRTSVLPPPPKETATTKWARIKKGKRPDIHPTYCFRSPTEANFARILQYLKQDFKFEERVFTFTGYKIKPFIYIPDFEILNNSEQLSAGFYEVKGWMNPASKSKLKRFKKHYPEEAENLIVVIYRKSDRDAKEFCDKLGYKTLYWDELKKQYEPLIPTWE